MHFSPIKARSFARSATVTISKGARLALLLCAILALAAVLLVASGTMANPNANASNPVERSGSQVNRKTQRGMVWIPRGTFLMGTNDKESFPNERPAHLVQVQGFWMDEHDVTNSEFSKFVEATGYVTTAERKIDWEDLKKELPPGTPKPDDSALAPGALVFTPTSGPVRSMTCRLGGVGCTEQTGAIPKALKALSRGEKIIPSFRSRGTTRWPMLSGPANGSSPRQNGNSPPAEDWNQNGTSGVTNSSRAANTWRIPGREYSQFETLAKMDLSALRRSVTSLRMATACTTWLGTCGNGAATGIGPTATSRLPAKTFVATLVDRLRVMIQAIRTHPSALSKAVHSFATPTTARVIARARDEERRQTPVRRTQVSAV
jgi:hypothetical protein